MSRLLYERSVSYQGYLIVPFVFNRADRAIIYSYTLLSERGYKGQFHKDINPAKLYSSRLEAILEIARQHLAKNTAIASEIDYFKNRYTYNNNLVILHQEGGKCFYDHYPPDELRNIAAPKLFNSDLDCINWVKQGLDRNRIRRPKPE